MQIKSVLAVIALAAIAIGAFGQDSKPPIIAIDSALQNSSLGPTNVGPAGSQLISSIASPELLVPDLQNALNRSVSGNKLQISESALCGVFSTWLSQIGGPTSLQPNVYDLHRYRQFLSRFAPSLFPRTNNGQVSYSMSAIEAIYLLDVMITHAGLPYLAEPYPYASTSSPKQQAASDVITQYQTAVAAYRNSTTLSNRISVVGGFYVSLGIK